MNYITQTNIGNGGRLGNQLFGLAATVGIGKKYNLAPVFPEWEYAKYFKNPLNVANIPVTDVYFEPYFHYTDVQGFNDSIQIFTGRDKCYDLKGYYQSARYWEHCEDEIKRMFELEPDMGASLRSMLNLSFGWHRKPICSIHVRRGDYVDNAFYAQIGMDYYNAAMDYVKSKSETYNFLIFSDDIPWCKENFKGEQFAFSEGLLDIQDLFLQSMCEYQIMANSSFSWWSAYLNKNPDKIIIAPAKWFGDNSVLDTKDLYTPNMIKL